MNPIRSGPRFARLLGLAACWGLGLGWSWFCRGAVPSVPGVGTVFVDVGGSVPSGQLPSGLRKFPLGQAEGAVEVLDAAERERVVVHLSAGLAVDGPRPTALRVALLAYEEFRRHGHGLAGRNVRTITEGKEAAEAVEANVLKARGLVAKKPVAQVLFRAFMIQELRLPEHLSVVLANRPEGLEPDSKEARLYDAEQARLAGLLFGSAATNAYPLPPPLTTAEIQRRLEKERRVRCADCEWTMSTNLAGHPALVLPLKVASRPLGVAIELSVAYGTAENFTAGGGVTLKNLATGVEDPAQPFDVLEFHGRGGPQIQEAGGSWTIPLKPDTEHFSYNLTASGDYFRDRKTAFALPVTDREDTRTWKGGGRLNATWDSFSPLQYLARTAAAADRKRVQYLVNASAGFDYDDTAIRAEKPATATLPEGTAGVANQHLVASLDWDPVDPGQPGIGAVLVETSFLGEQGLGLGDGYDHSKWQAAFGVTLHFGWHDCHDYLFRQTVATGALSGVAPELHRFRLGGQQPVRGLQEGELTGNSVALSSTEFGFNLGQLFRKRPAAGAGESSDDPTGGDAESAKSEDDSGGGLARQLDGMYLKAILDWAQVSPVARADAAWRDGESAIGYGVFLEIPRQAVGGRWLSLSLGYAYSPDSRLHRGGLFVASTSFPF